MFRKTYIAIYSLLLTNYVGFHLSSKKRKKSIEDLRKHYSTKLLKKMLNIDVTVSGLENIPQNQKFVLISNHRSVIDPLIIDLALNETNTPLGYWLAKEDLYKSPFFGKFTRNAGTILVSKDKSDTIKLISEVKERIDEGNSIYLFPEGTRNKTDKNLIDFQKGASLIALKNKLDILPVYIKTRADLTLKKSLISKKNQTIEVCFGEIIDRKNRKIEETYKKSFSIA